MEKIFIHEDDLSRLFNMGRGYFGGGFASEGQYWQPAAAVLLADTGPLIPGIYDVSFIVSCGTALGPDYVLVEQYKTGGVDTIFSFACGAVANHLTRLPFKGVKVLHGERFKSRTVDAVNNSIGCLIHYTRVFPLEKGD